MDQDQKKWIDLLERYFDVLWPICRSITGDGLRESFSILQELVPFKLSEIPTGTQVYDWTIPKEWNIRDAYLQLSDGRKIAKFKDHNLHVVNYSVPVDAEMNYQEIIKNIHTISELPDAIPYITSYYKEYWGFCMSQKEFDSLPKNGKIRAYIDSDLKDGSLTFGEAYLPGKSKKEIFFSSYLCHPSMANNELSGPLLLSYLYNAIEQMPDRKYSYRFILVPETIGTIAYLAKFGTQLKENAIAGYVLTCVGDNGPFTYKQSKNPENYVDLIAEHILKHQDTPYSIMPFSVGGSDERQYCSPGFNLPVGSLMRSMYQTYKEYHTSLDNKDFISFKSLVETGEVYMNIVKAFELNSTYLSTVQYCEPQLGKRNLYPDSVHPSFQRESLHDLLHLLSYCDGKNDLLSIAEKREKSIFKFEEHLKKCISQNLIDDTKST